MLGENIPKKYTFKKTDSQEYRGSSQIKSQYQWGRVNEILPRLSAYWERESFLLGAVAPDGLPILWWVALTHIQAVVGGLGGFTKFLK